MSWRHPCLIYRLLQHALYVVQLQDIIVLPVPGQRRGREDDVADLPPVEPRKVGSSLVVLCNPLDHAPLVLDKVLAELVDQVRKDGRLLLLGQVFELDGEVDTRLDRDVEGADAVGGEDQDALVVLEHPEQDYGVMLSAGLSLVGVSGAHVPETNPTRVTSVAAARLSRKTSASSLETVCGWARGLTRETGVAYKSMTACQAAASSNICSSRFSTNDGSVVTSPTPMGNSGFPVTCATLSGSRVVNDKSLCNNHDNNRYH